MQLVQTTDTMINFLLFDGSIGFNNQKRINDTFLIRFLDTIRQILLNLWFLFLFLYSLFNYSLQLEKGVDGLFDSFARLDSRISSVGQTAAKIGDHLQVICSYAVSLPLYLLDTHLTI